MLRKNGIGTVHEFMLRKKNYKPATNAPATNDKKTIKSHHDRFGDLLPSVTEFPN